jgi:hypothetical protein
MAIQLGTIATDSITGFKGVAVVRTEFLFECVRIGLMPKALKDGLPQEKCYFDERQLKEDDKKTPAPSKWLGKQVTDSITGVQGTVTSVSTYLYMAPRVCITPKGTFEGKPLETVDCDEAQLVEYDAPKVAKRTGGPGDKAPMHRAAPRC